MGIIKKVLKQTPFYRLLKAYRHRKQTRQWTDHDQKMADFYSMFISEDDLVFDVGANIGNRTKIFLKMAATVIAIEPQDQCIRRLETEFGKNSGFTLVNKVLGPSEGEAELMISNADTISSLSKDWINAVKESGRFSDYQWNKKKIVPMTTIDKLIESFGTPIFIKIDVEGFEHEVIRGLSKPIRGVSIEFTPEYFESTLLCIKHLDGLGNYQYNYSLGESMQLELKNYISPEELVKILEDFTGKTDIFGDVYCRCTKCY